MSKVIIIDKQIEQPLKSANLCYLSLMACTGLARLANQIERQPTETSARARTDELIDGLRKLRETLQSRSDLSPDGQAETQTRNQD